MKKLLFPLLLFVNVMTLCALTVTDLEKAMLSSSPDILKARQEVSKALLDVKDAKAGFTPTIDLTITGSYIANPIDPIRINLGDYIDTTAYGVGNDYITLYSGQESMYYQFSLSLTQPVFTWGKLTNAVKLYQQIYEARILQLQDASEKAATEIRTRAAAVHYLLGIREVLEKQVSTVSRLVELADDAQKNGMMLETQALSVKVQARQLDVAVAQVERQIALMMTEIRNLTGLKDLQAQDIEFDEADLEKLVEELGSTAYEVLSARILSDNRTNFRLLSALSVIAQLTNEVARGAVNWKPDVALVVNADYSGSRMPLLEKDWYGKDDWSATITIALKTTIVDGGKAVRNVTRTQGDVESAEIDIAGAKAKVGSAMDENITNLAVLGAEIDYQKAMGAQLEAQSNVNRNLLDTGYGSESDFLQGQLELNNCSIEILRKKIELAAAAFTLMYLQGEVSI
ncbi:MAG: TolC family protein [Spirochaetales bacterium]|nr:TolC family protein [Spirochaetales bacterium]